MLRLGTFGGVSCQNTQSPTFLWDQTVPMGRKWSPQAGLPCGGMVSLLGWDEEQEEGHTKGSTWDTGPPGPPSWRQSLVYPVSQYNAGKGTSPNAFPGPVLLSDLSSTLRANFPMVPSVTVSNMIHSDCPRGTDWRAKHGA